MHPFSFGSDPEFMLQDADGNLRSAIPVVLGSGDNPIRVGENAYYHDNVNVEMTISPGVGKAQVLNNFRDAFKTCADMVSPLRMVPRASGDFHPSELEDPEAKEIACNPEFCAYMLQELDKPVAQFQASTFRSAGGHIHLGASDDSGSSLRDPLGFVFVVRCLDLFLGVPSLYMDHDPTSRRRKELYGLAGSHRWKRYGVEYRALGNFWLASPSLVEVVHDICEFTIDFVNQERHLMFWTVDRNKMDDGEEPADCIYPTGIDQHGLRECLNMGNKTAAKPFLSLAESHMPQGLFADIRQKFNPVTYDFYQEWSL